MADHFSYEIVEQDIEFVDNPCFALVSVPGCVRITDLLGSRLSLADAPGASITISFKNSAPLPMVSDHGMRNNTLNPRFVRVYCV